MGLDDLSFFPHPKTYRNPLVGVYSELFKYQLHPQLFLSPEIDHFVCVSTGTSLNS